MFFFFLYSHAKSNTVLGLTKTAKDVFPAILRPVKHGISHMLKESYQSSQAVGFL